MSESTQARGPGLGHEPASRGPQRQALSKKCSSGWTSTRIIIVLNLRPLPLLLQTHSRQNVKRELKSYCLLYHLYGKKLG